MQYLVEQRVLDTNAEKATVLSYHRCVINTGVEKNKQHLNIDWSFDHQMSQSKSKCWHSNDCLHFLKSAVPLLESNFRQNLMVFHQNIYGNMKFRYCLIIIDHQIDEKHQFSSI
jgi:hypothetical protein